MSSIRQIGFCALLGFGLVTACAATPDEAAERAEAQARIDAEISLRQGEAVGRICPGVNDGWRALGDDTLLLEARGEWYMAELAGGCDPQSASAMIATRSSPASSCLNRGDNIITGRPRSGERCVITAIYEWNDDAEAGTSAAVQD